MNNEDKLAKLTENRKAYIENLFKNGYERIKGHVQIVASKPVGTSGDNQVNLISIRPLKIPGSDEIAGVESSINAGRDLLGKLIESEGIIQAKNFMAYAYTTLLSISDGETEIPVPEGTTKQEVEDNLIYGVWMMASHMQDSAPNTGVVEVMDTFLFLTPKFEFKESGVSLSK